MTDECAVVGWSRVPLRQVATIQLGKMLDKAKNSGDLRPYLRNVNVRWFGFDLRDIAEIRMSTDEAEKFSIRDGDLLVCEGGEPGRCAVWRGGPTSLTYQKALHRVRVSKALHPDFLAWQLRLDALCGNLSKYFTGSTIKHLPQIALERYPVSVAPRGEQQRIADKLDTVLARVDACRDRLTRMTPLLKRFRQSVLAAATEGHLTTEWRQWAPFVSRQYVFGDLVRECLVGLVRASVDQFDLSKNSTPYVKMNNISEDWGCDLTHLVGIQCTNDERERYTLRAGDWLFNTRNSVELVGKSCMWHGDSAVFNNNILRVRFNEMANPGFVEVWFRSPAGRTALNAIKSATTSVAAIYQRSLMAMLLDLPSTEEQAEIVRRVKTLFAFADRLGARLAAAQSAIDRLTPALLAKAFRGELVPQDPADEPAAELLKRLHAQTSQGPQRAAPKRGRPAQKAAA